MQSLDASIISVDKSRNTFTFKSNTGIAIYMSIYKKDFVDNSYYKFKDKQQFSDTLSFKMEKAGHYRFVFEYMKMNPNKVSLLPPPNLDPIPPVPVAPEEPHLVLPDIPIPPDINHIPDVPIPPEYEGLLNPVFPTFPNLQPVVVPQPPDFAIPVIPTFIASPPVPDIPLVPDVPTLQPGNTIDPDDYIQQYKEELQKFKDNVLGFYKKAIDEFAKEKAIYDATRIKVNAQGVFFQDMKKIYDELLASFGTAIAKFMSDLTQYNSDRDKYRQAIANYRSLVDKYIQLKVAFSAAMDEYGDSLNKFAQALVKYNDEKDTYNQQVENFRTAVIAYQAKKAEYNAAIDAYRARFNAWNNGPKYEKSADGQYYINEFLYTYYPDMLRNIISGIKMVLFKKEDARSLYNSKDSTAQHTMMRILYYNALTYNVSSSNFDIILSVMQEGLIYHSNAYEDRMAVCNIYLQEKYVIAAYYLAYLFDALQYKSDRSNVCAMFDVKMLLPMVKALNIDIDRVGSRVGLSAEAICGRDNTQPVVRDMTLDIKNRTTYTFTEEVFLSGNPPIYMDADDDPPGHITFITLPEQGILKFKDTPIIQGQRINFSEVGMLTYEPLNIDDAYIASFKFIIDDLAVE